MDMKFIESLLLILFFLVPTGLAQINCTEDKTFECLDGNVIVTHICSATGYIETNSTCQDGTPTTIKEGPPEVKESVGIPIIKIIYFIGFLLLLVLVWWLMNRKAMKDIAEEEEEEFKESIELPPPPQTNVQNSPDDDQGPQK